MIPASFDYKVAESAEQAIALLGEYGDESKLLAGGHSLIPMMKFRLAAPTVLIDVARITDLSYIREAGDHLAIGAMTKHVELETSAAVAQHAPMLGHVASLVLVRLQRMSSSPGTSSQSLQLTRSSPRSVFLQAPVAGTTKSSIAVPKTGPLLVSALPTVAKASVW